MIKLAVIEGKSIGPNHLKKYFAQCTKADLGFAENFQQFAFYLARKAVTDITTKKAKGKEVEENQDGQPIAMSSAMQYLSNFYNSILRLPGKVQFFDDFKHLPKGESPPWMKPIRDDLRNTMERDLMLAVIPTILKAKGIGRGAAEGIVDVLIDGVRGN